VLRDETSDADLAQALEQNLFVTEIEMSLDGERGANWNYLLRVIATRANLKTVELHSARNALALVRSILQAVQQNTSIRNVKLWQLRLPTDISTFMDNMSSITSFSIWDCDIEAVEHDQGARRRLAAALQRTTNIETLELRILADTDAIPILQSLRSNAHLKTFIYTGRADVSDTVSNALHQLLDSSTSIQRLDLQDRETLRPIAQSLIQSGIVCELKFSNCGFISESSIAQFQSILQNKQNLSSLWLHHCHFGGGQVHEAITSTLLRPDSSLRCF